MDPSSAQDHQLFVHAHPEWFESLDRYLPGDELLRVVRAVVPAAWRVRREGAWLHFAAPDLRPPRQGWKIHVSATAGACEATFEKAAAACVRHGASFRCAIDRRMAQRMTAKGWPRESSSKLITVYPADEAHFRAVIEALRVALGSAGGPHVLSDRSYRGTRGVSYRYGVIAGEPVLAVTGQRRRVLLSPGGEAVPDDCLPFWNSPPWVSDPFPADEKADDRGPNLGDGRFQIHGALGFSATGGTYVATDLDTGATVIVKEAMPLVGEDDRGLNAAERLRREHRLLQRLADTGVVPAPVALFEEEEHLFLVEDLAPGKSLSNVTATLNPFVLGSGTARRRATHARLLMQIWTHLALALDRLHERGVLLCNLSARNVIVTDLEVGTIKLVDLEAAQELGPDGAFAGPAATAEDDLLALGTVLAGTLCPPAGELMSLGPGAAADLGVLGGRSLGVPPQVQQVMLDCLGDAGRRPKAGRVVEVLRGHAEPCEPAGDLPGPDREALLALARAAMDYVQASADVHRTDRLFPADPAVFRTNPLSLSAGAAGVAHALARIRGEVPRDVRAWMLSRAVTPDLYPPGLYVGAAGVAWALWEIGLEEAAVQILGAAHGHPLLWDAAGLFHGASGYGLACLRFHQGTGEQEHLDRAVAVGDWLLRHRTERAGACCWPDGQGNVAVGYAHGSSGVALFLLCLDQATGDGRFLAAGRAALEHDLARALPQTWLDGGAGVGTVLLRYWRATGEARYLDLVARLAPDTSPAFTAHPGLFQGLAGWGNFLLDAYAFTRAPHYLRQASVVAGRVSLFALKRPAGIAFPGAAMARLSTDFGTGSSGIALFLHRLAHAGEGMGNFNFTLDRPAPARPT